jgi:hypothetical protein
MKKLILLLLMSVSIHGIAGGYAIQWFKVAGGGGPVSGGGYAINGTAGQQDAGSAVSGGGYSLQGGFWAGVIQTAGLPLLHITPAGNGVIVSWADTGSYTLQTNGNLGTTNWIAYGGSVSTANGTNSVTISPARGNLFFRLYNPDP